MRQLRPIALALAMLAGLVSAECVADTPLSLGLGVKLMPTSWSGENTNSNTDFDATDGRQFGLTALLQKGNFYSGLSFQGGEYTFDDGGPEQVPRQPGASGSVVVERGEFDLVFGYYFWSRVSLFLDLKALGNDYRDIDYKQDFTGVGVGISGFWPLSERWLLFGSFGFVPNGNVEVNGNSVGDGDSSALELGGIFGFDQRNRLNFGFKFQNQTYDFDNGQKQEHQLNGVFLGYQHVFLF